MITKIISGGQTGGDYGGLLAGKELGLKTGGYCPAGWKTDNGANIELENFGLKCTSTPEYPPRTRLNIAHSDGTVGFGIQSSRGMRLTQRICEDLDKPYIKILFPSIPEYYDTITVAFVQWILLNEIKTLNVAGNRESGNAGIQQFTREFLIGTIKGI